MDAIKIREQSNFYRVLKHAVGLMGGEMNHLEGLTFLEVETKLRENGIKLSFSFDSLLYERHFD